MPAPIMVRYAEWYQVDPREQKVCAVYQLLEWDDFLAVRVLRMALSGAHWIVWNGLDEVERELYRHPGKYMGQDGWEFNSKIVDFEGKPWGFDAPADATAVHLMESRWGVSRVRRGRMPASMGRRLSQWLPSESVVWSKWGRSQWFGDLRKAGLSASVGV